MNPKYPGLLWILLVGMRGKGYEFAQQLTITSAYVRSEFAVFAADYISCVIAAVVVCYVIRARARRRQPSGGPGGSLGLGPAVQAHLLIF